MRTIISNTPTLRWAGIKGHTATIAVSTEEIPRVTISGDAGGTIAFALTDIEKLRAGPDFGRLTQYHCYIWRRGQWAINIGGHREIVLYLAEKMAALGHADRVQRGLPFWMALVHLLLFGGLGLVLLYGSHDIVLRATDADDMLVAGLALIVGLAASGWALWSWFRHYRPRPVRDLDDLTKALP